MSIFHKDTLDDAQRNAVMGNLDEANKIIEEHIRAAHNFYENIKRHRLIEPTNAYLSTLESALNSSDYREKAANMKPSS